jgi:hypothetical protein
MADDDRSDPVPDAARAVAEISAELRASNAQESRVLNALGGTLAALSPLTTAERRYVLDKIAALMGVDARG